MILNINARSLVNKVTDLEAILFEHDPHITTITETWLSSGIANPTIFPPGYTILRKDRGSRGGGVAILVKNHILTTPLPDVSGAEALWCKIKLNRSSIYVGTMYRPPNSSIDSLHKLTEYMQHHFRPSDKIILTGDFNLTGIAWAATNCESSENVLGQALLDTAFNFNLKQVILEPTRVTPHTQSILDLTFISDNFSNPKLEWEIVDGISDHNATKCCLVLNEALRTDKEIAWVYDWGNADDVSIIDSLALGHSTFSCYFAERSVSLDDLWQFFKTTVERCLSMYVPKKVKRIRKNNPWITRNIIHLKRKICRLRKLKHKCALPCHARKIQDHSTTLKTLIREAKHKYTNVTLKNFITSCPHKFWRFLNVKKNNQNKLSPKEALDKANMFNKFFQSVFTMDDGNQPEIMQPLPDTSLQIAEITVTESGILSLLLNLNPKKACGPDNIPNAFLLRYAEWVAKYLLLIYKRSLDLGVVPIDWKLAKVTPVPKSGNMSDPSNYRPISLTCTAGKILEHIILRHIIAYTEEHGLINPNQHGFRRGLSTVTQLTETLHDLALTLDNRGQTDIIFLDLSKAFDRVSHPKLLYKLQVLLGKGMLLKWLASYLSGRHQFVHCGNQSSDILEVTSGVPQGTVLAPILFLLYIDDIAYNINATVRMFADDCIIYKVIKNKNDQIALNQALSKITCWCQEWQMSFNAKKTVAMTVSRKKEPLIFPYEIQQTQLEMVQEYKYLGIIISHDLKWDKQVAFVTNKALASLYSLKRSICMASPDTKLLAFKSLVRPILEYGIICWFPHTKHLIAKLENVQRRAIRFIFNKYKRHDSPTELLRRAELPTLSERAKLLRLKFLFQLIHGRLKIPCQKFITPSATRSTRTKHDKHLIEYRFHNDSFKYSYFPCVIREWNCLPNDIVTSSSLDNFTSKMSTFLSNSAP